MSEGASETDANLPDLKREDLRHHIILALIPGLGPRLTARLIEQFGSPAAALNAAEKELLGIPQFGPKLARATATALRTINPDEEFQRMQQHRTRALLLGESAYPAALATIPDPPPLLYLRGEILASDASAVAIVGSRQCTPYGLRMAERLAAGLARAGWTVVSGLARGIDGAAHHAALQAGGRTLAVLANGLSTIYPPEHAELAQRVSEQGALLTEATMNAAPQAGMFPARNRIISGLSQAVVVVEANLRSGALITIEHAAEQGRPVFAVPGPVDSPASAGCLELIRNGATMIRSADDILEDLRGIAPIGKASSGPESRRGKPTSLFDATTEPAVEKAAVPPLEPGLQRIWDLITVPRHADELARDSGLAVGELTRILMTLEMKKRIRRLPGNRYERRS